MATYVPFMPIPIQIQDSAGDNLESGTLEFFESGTSTPTNLFSDNAGTSIGTSITLNASGYPESGGNVITLFRDAAVAIKVVAKDSGGSTQWTSDTLDGSLVVLASTANAKGASLVSIEDSGGNFTATEVEAALAEIASNYLQDVSDDTTPTLGGNIDCNDLEVQKPEIKDFAVTHTTPSSSSGTLTLDCENGNSFAVTLTENVTTVTLSNPPASGNHGQISILFTQDGTGGWTVTWPASVLWPGGTAPTISAAASAVDRVSLATVDGGTTWYGTFSQDYS